MRTALFFVVLLKKILYPLNGRAKGASVAQASFSPAVRAFHSSIIPLKVVRWVVCAPVARPVGFVYCLARFLPCRVEYDIALSKLPCAFILNKGPVIFI